MCRCKACNKIIEDYDTLSLEEELCYKCRGISSSLVDSTDTELGADHNYEHYHITNVNPVFSDYEPQVKTSHNYENIADKGYFFDLY